MTDLHVLCTELKVLATQPETPALRQKVETDFNSKWTGVQVCAARVLAAWGGRRSIELLKAWVEKWYRGNERIDRVMRTTASDILAKCIEPTDANWVLETYLTIGYASAGMFALWRCIDKCPFTLLQERLVQESISDDRMRRLAALNFLIGLHQPQETRELIERFLDDADSEIQRSVNYYIYSRWNVR